MKLLDKIIEVSLGLLVFLFPAIVLPGISGAPAFAKVALLLVFSVWLLGLWSLKVLLTRKLFLPASPFTKPLFTLLATILFSTAFSLTPKLSFFGTLPTLFPSALSWLSLFLIFWLVSALANGKIRLRLLPILLFSLTATSVIAALAYLQAEIFFNWSYLIPFLPTLSVNTSGIVTALGAILALTLLVGVDRLWQKIFLAIALAVCLSVASVFFSLPAGLALGGGLVSLAVSGFEWRRLAERKIFLIPPVMLAGAIFLLVINPSLQGSLGLKISPPKELTLDGKTSWAVTALILRDRPWLGSGPGTFGTQFVKYLPLEFIQGPIWALRFDRPGSEFLHLLSVNGVLGCLAFVFLIYKLGVAAWQLKRGAKDFPQVVATALAVGLVAALLVYSANILLAGLLILFLVLTRKPEAEAVPLRGQWVYLGSIILGLDVILAAVVGYGLWRGEQAEVWEKRGVEFYQRGEVMSALDFFGQAKDANPYFDQYLINHAIASTNAALAVGARAEATEEEKRLALQLIQQAVNSTQQSLALNPENATFWEILARIYQPLIGSVKDADRFAVEAYQKARSLAPTDPDLALRFGQLFYQYRNLNQALNLFVEAARLRPMHANARFNLAVTLKELGSYKEALGEMEVVTRLISPESQDMVPVNQQIEELRKLVAEMESKQKEAEGAKTSPVPLSTESQPRITLPGESSPSSELNE